MSTPLPSTPESAPLVEARAASGHSIRDLQFTSGGDLCAARLFLPPGPGPHPVIVFGHGLAAVKELRLPDYARSFAAAGFGSFLFDYRHFGASAGEPRQLLNFAQQRRDWREAINCARSLPEIDPARVAIWGTSLGAGHALVLAAEVPEIRATVLQCPFTDGLRDAAPQRGWRQSALLLAHGFRDGLHAALGLRPHYVKVCARPGQTALLNSPGAEDGYRLLVAQSPGGHTWRNEVAARVIIAFLFYRPVRWAARIPGPVLAFICDLDREVSPAAARDAIAQIPHGEAASLPITHFQLYGGEWYEKIVARQIEFFRRHLG